MNSKTAELAKLTRNPFSLVADTNTDVWADYKDVREKLLDVITSCRVDQVGLSEFVVLHGEIGTGKSHALRYLQNHILNEKPEDFQAPCVYLESTKLAKKTDFLAIYRRVIEALRKHIIETAHTMDTAFEQKAKATGATKAQEILQAKQRLWRESAAELAPTFPSLILLLHGVIEDESNAFTLLCGGKGTDLGKYQLTSLIDSEYDATKCLSSYINMVIAPNRDVLPASVFPGSRAFYLFIDEVELLQDFKPAEVLSVNQGVRDLINACPQGFCLIFGVSGDPRILFAIFDKFVVRRFSRDPIEIQALDDEEAVRFLIDVLRNYRLNPADPPAFPFDKDSLQRIAEKTPEKTAASLFRNARRVLERSVLTGRLEEKGVIGQMDVDEFLI